MFGRLLAAEEKTHFRLHTREETEDDLLLAE